MPIRLVRQATERMPARRVAMLALCLATLGLSTLSTSSPAASYPTRAPATRAGVADFRVFLSTARSTVAVGKEQSVSIGGERLSGDAVTFLAVRIRVDSGTDLSPGAGLGCAGSLPEITCDIGTSQFGPPGGDHPVSFRSTLGVTFSTPGEHTLTATLIVLEATDPDLADNSSSVSLRVLIPRRVTVSAVTLTPPAPKAGSTLAASVRVSKDGSPVRPVGITCSAVVANVRHAGTGRSASGTASCLFKTPRSARGKRLGGTISFKASGVKVTERFSVRLD